MAGSTRNRLAVLIVGLPCVLTVVALAMSDERHRRLYGHTFSLVCGTLAIALPIGIVLAVLLARTDLPGRRVGGLLLAAQLLSPLYLQAAAWQAGFGLQGWYTQIFMTHQPAWLEGWRGAIWVHAMAAVPWITLIVGLGLRLAEPELEEQALLDASQWAVFLRVTLRRSLPAICAAALWVAVVVAGEITVTDLYGVRTYAEEVYTDFTLGDPAQAEVAALPVLAIMGWLALAAVLLCNRLATLGPRGGALHLWTFRLGRWRAPALLFAVALLVLVAGVPLVDLIYMAGKVARLNEGRLIREWSVRKCIEMTVSSPWNYHREYLGSLKIAMLAATAALAIGIPLAWLARRGGWRGAVVLTITALCAAIPGPTLAIGLIRIFDRPGWTVLNYLYDHTSFVPCLVQAMRGLPLVVLIGWQALRGIPRETLEAAAVDGAGPIRRFLFVALPQRRPALVLAWTTALIVALGELPGTLLVVRPGESMLSIRIFELIHYGVEDRLAGLCLSLMGLFVLAAIAIRAAIRSVRSRSMNST